MKISLIKAVLVIAIGICLVDSKVIEKRGKRQVANWERAKVALNGMKKPMVKRGSKVGDIPAYVAGQLGDAVKAIDKGKLKGLKYPTEKLGGKMGGIPAYGGGQLGDTMKAFEKVWLHNNKLKGMKYPTEKQGGKISEIPAYGAGQLGDAVKAINKGKFKGLKYPTKKLGGKMGGIPAYGAGQLGDAVKAVNKDHLKGMKFPMEKMGGKMGGIPTYGAGRLGDVVGAVPSSRGQQRVGKGRKLKGTKVRPGSKIPQFGAAPVGDALQEVEEVLQTPSSACSCAQEDGRCDTAKAPQGVARVLLCYYHQDTGCLACSRQRSDEAEVEFMGPCCASANLAKDLMKVDPETDDATAGRTRGRHHTNCTSCQVYRDDGTGSLVKTTTVDERALGGQCGLFPGLPDTLLEAYYKSEKCKIILQGTACSEGNGDDGADDIDGVIEGVMDGINDLIN